MVEVTLGDVLLFTYPGVEWTLIRASRHPRTPSLTLWDSDEPQPTHRGARGRSGTTRARRCSKPSGRACFLSRQVNITS